MKRSHLLTLTLFLGLTLLLSACVPGPRVTGTPGIELSEERTFVAFGNFVYSLEIESGAIDWQFPDQANNQVVFYSQPLVTDEFVYVGDLANNFHKLDIETGELAWTFSESRGYYVGQAAEADGIVYAPSNDGSVYAIDANGDLEWAFATGHYVWAQPVISSDAIFVGSMDHFIYAVSMNGEEIWSVQMAGAVVGTPVLSEDETTLFVSSIGNEIAALSASSGDRLWTFSTEASVWGRAVLADGTLYVADSDGNLYALDPATGEPTWQTEFAGSVVGGVTGISDGIVLATEEGVVKAFNFDGSPKWEATLDGEIFQAPAVNDQFLVAGTINGDNLVYAFNLAGVQRWSTTPEN